jgi:hypothetical protein
MTMSSMDIVRSRGIFNDHSSQLPEYHAYHAYLGGAYLKPMLQESGVHRRSTCSEFVVFDCCSSLIVHPGRLFPQLECMLQVHLREFFCSDHSDVGASDPPYIQPVWCSAVRSSAYVVFIHGS